MLVKFRRDQINQMSRLEQKLAGAPMRNSRQLTTCPKTPKLLLLLARALSLGGPPGQGGVTRMGCGGRITGRGRTGRVTGRGCEGPCCTAPS